MATDIARFTDGCLLYQGYARTIALNKKLNSNGTKKEDFYKVAFVDVFANMTTLNNTCTYKLMNNLLNLLGPHDALKYDGLYLRGNSPYTISNGSDLNISHYVINATGGQEGNSFMGQLKKESKRLLEATLGVTDPESIGTYEGYKLDNNQSKIDFNNLPFVPGFKNGGDMYSRTLDNNIRHKGFGAAHPNHTAGVPHLYLHNQYGFIHHQLHYNQSILNFKKGERPNVYSESTWPGSGFYGGSF